MLVPLAGGQQTEWIRQFGSSSLDAAYGISVDDSRVYVAGSTNGALPGQASSGGVDAFVRKYDFDGNEVWTRQFGSSSSDYAFGISADASGVYVAGLTEGALPGQASSGGFDAFVRKYDFDGNEVWTRQFGSSSSEDNLRIYVDASGVYVAGATNGALPGQASSGNHDAFVRKYDSDGNEVWTRQFGTSSSDVALGISAAASGVYVVGQTFGTFPGQASSGNDDAFVRKYDLDGNEVWTRQFGTSSSDVAFGISVATSGVYVAGSTLGTFPGQTSSGIEDAFVRKFDTSGTELWTRQFGTSDFDRAEGVYADDSGAYVAGWANDALPGQTHAGSNDVVVRKYDVSGTELWTRQFGASASDHGFAISVHASGVYVAGHTDTALPGQTSSGEGDAFVAKLSLEPRLLTIDLTGEVDYREGERVPISVAALVREAETRVPVSDADVTIRVYDRSTTLLIAATMAEVIPGTGVFQWTSPGTIWDLRQTFPPGVYLVVVEATRSIGPTARAILEFHVTPVVPSQEIMWIREFGTFTLDVARGISADASGVFVAGQTSGVLPGQTSPGSNDAFVRKYNTAGTEVWTHQFGTAGGDIAYGVSVDASGVYVTGHTGGVFPGQSSSGGVDAFVRKYDATGAEVWTRQFGSADTDEAFAIAVDASGVYVVGETLGTLPGQISSGGVDAFVRKYDVAGTHVWTRQFGSIGGAERALAVSVDASGVYLAGRTDGAFPGQTSSGSDDAFVRKYDVSGTELWTRQFGTSDFDMASGIAAASGVFVAGLTAGALPGQTSSGNIDAFVRKYDVKGNEVWTRQFGKAEAGGISVDATGVYVAGETISLPDQTPLGGTDAFVRKYDAAGTEVWTRQFGTPDSDVARSISVDATGVYLAGDTEGTFAGQTNSGDTDAFVGKFSPAPVPLTIELTGEVDYKEGEKIRISVAALVRDAEARTPVSDANVELSIYDQNSVLLVFAVIVEVLPGTGVYQWTSSNTIRILDQVFVPGIYLAVVEASRAGEPVARASLEFHIDPPGRATPAGGFPVVELVAVIATGGITGLLLRRREVARIIRRWGKRS